ncbi:hypothetical protein ACP70R_009097 [Stipagrostis hirtigluma subsp. patula]
MAAEEDTEGDDRVIEIAAAGALYRGGDWEPKNWSCSMVWIGEMRKRSSLAAVQLRSAHSLVFLSRISGHLGKDRYPYPAGYHTVNHFCGICYTMEMEIQQGPRGPVFLVRSLPHQPVSAVYGNRRCPDELNSQITSTNADSVTG